MRSARLLALILTLGSACEASRGTTTPRTGRSSDASVRDAGPQDAEARDAQAPDAPSTDAEPGSDAPAPHDSGFPSHDSGFPPQDSGSPRDAGFPPDTGFPPDAGQPQDAGAPSCSAPLATPGLVLNEVDYDMPGTDSAEFVEIYNGTPNRLCLADLELVLVNGDGPDVYARIMLAAAGPALDPGAYLVVADPSFPLPPGTLRAASPSRENWLQNGGPDGLLLLDRAAHRAVDALSYEGEIRAVTVDGAVFDLVEGRPCSVQDNANALSLGRSPNGVDTNDATLDWTRIFTPSPGGPNRADPPDAGVPSDGGPSTPDAGFVVEGAYLYTGAGGGGPTSDLDVPAMEATLRGAGIPVTTSASPPAFEVSPRLLAILNPMDVLPSGLISAARRTVDRGGRLLLVMEHCKNGCWGNAAEMNRILTALPSTLRLVGTGGAPLSPTTLNLIRVPPLTDGVTDLVVYYSGSVTPGTGTALGTVPGGDVVIGYEWLGTGDVVAVADSSIFGYVLASGQNRRFLVNLAR